MATTIRISGTDIERLKGSLNIYNAIEQRSTASFTVVDRTGVASYIKGQSVTIFTGWPIPPFIHPLFAGFIEVVDRRRVSPKSDTIYWTLDCIDNHYLADKRIAVKVYTDKTAGFIVDDLITEYLAAEGVSAGTIQAGPTFEETIINYQSLSNVFDVLAEKANFIWYIDRGKQLFFMERTTDDAPFDIDSSDINREGTSMASELREANPSYRNTQYLRGGKALTSLQTETFTTQDATVTAFVLGYPVAQEPDSITEDAAGKTIGIKGVDVGVDYFWSKGEATIVAAVPPGNGVVVEVKYYGEYSLFVLTEDVVAIAALQAIEGGTGIVENMGDSPATITRDDLAAAALAKLNRFGINGKMFTFPIDVWGLEPGQMVTVDYAEYDLNSAELLIESIEVTEFAPNQLRYMIRAIEGPELGDWTGFFKRLSEQEGNILNRLTIGEDRILHILKSQAEALALVEATDFHTDAYPPDTSRWIALYPAQGASHHVRHEALALAEVVADTETLTEDYYWG